MVDGGYREISSGIHGCGLSSQSKGISIAVVTVSLVRMITNLTGWLTSKTKILASARRCQISIVTSV